MTVPDQRGECIPGGWIYQRKGSPEPSYGRPTPLGGNLLKIYKGSKRELKGNLEGQKGEPPCESGLTWVLQVLGTERGGQSKKETYWERWSRGETQETTKGVERE